MASLHGIDPILTIGSSFEDLEQILSPTMEGDCSVRSDTRSSCSAEAIIERVEAEIANAKVLAHNDSAESFSSNSDMDKILDVVSSQEFDEIFEQQRERSSFEDALEAFSCEFDSPKEKSGLEEGTKKVLAKTEVDGITGEVSSKFTYSEKGNPGPLEAVPSLHEDTQIPKPRVYSQLLTSDTSSKTASLILLAREETPFRRRLLARIASRGEEAQAHIDDAKTVLDKVQGQQTDKNSTVAVESRQDRDDQESSMDAQLDNVEREVKGDAVSINALDANFTTTFKRDSFGSSPKQESENNTLTMSSNENQTSISADDSSKARQYARTINDIHGNDMNIRMEPKLEKELPENKSSSSPVSDENSRKNEAIQNDIAISEKQHEVVHESESNNNETSSDGNKQLKRIRFREPFPVLKPPQGPRDPQKIVIENGISFPETRSLWYKPTADLEQLLVAIRGPSLHRRSNACGALKVLLTKTKNQEKLVRMEGLIGALIYATIQEIPEGPDEDLALLARTRAVACLRNLCEGKENRVFLLSQEGFSEALLKVIKDDRDEARVLACGALALLSKSPHCREKLTECDDLIDAMAQVLGGRRLFQSTSDGSGFERDKDMISFTGHCGGNDSCASKADRQTRVKPTKSNSLYKGNAKSSDEYESKARPTACAFLLHLSKNCAISPLLASNATLLESLVSVGKESETTLRNKCLEIIYNLSRFPANNIILVLKEGIIRMLKDAVIANREDDRIIALQTFQNISACPQSKKLLASETILNLITTCTIQRENREQQVAAAVLYNISTEPANVVSITNTKNTIATLVQLAHNVDNSTTVRQLACESLSTISLWLQTVAETGRVPSDIPNVPLPSQKFVGWECWD